MTKWESKIGVVSGVISSTESESEESEHFHFFRFRLRLRRSWSSKKLGCRSRKQKRKNQPIARPRVEHCHWFILPLLLVTPTIQFSLDRKRQSHKRNQCLIFTRSIALRFWLRLRLRLHRWWKPALNDTLKQSIKIRSSSPRWLWKETPKSFSSQAHRKTYKSNCMCCISQVLKIKQCNTKSFCHYLLPKKNTYWFWKK